MTQQKKFFSLLITTLVLIFTSLSFAKTINLYDQPKADAKITGTLDTNKGIIPIFTPKEGQWVKVGDPSNGNVGWIKTSDLGTEPGAASSFTFMQHMFNDGKGPQNYQFILSGPQKLTPEQMKDMQLRQQQVQEAFKKMMQDMYKDLGDMMNPILNKNTPVVMPLIVAPEQKPVAPLPANSNPATTPAK